MGPGRQRRQDQGLHTLSRPLRIYTRRHSNLRDNQNQIAPNPVLSKINLALLVRRSWFLRSLRRSRTAKTEAQSKGRRATLLKARLWSGGINKKSLYRSNWYKPRIDVNLWLSRLSLRVRQRRTRQSQNLKALYQPHPHILLRKKQWGPAKSRLKMPALLAVDTAEYRQSTSYLNHQPADSSYCLIQGQ